MDVGLDVGLDVGPHRGRVLDERGRRASARVPLPQRALVACRVEQKVALDVEAHRRPPELMIDVTLRFREVRDPGAGQWMHARIIVRKRIDVEFALPVRCAETDRGHPKLVGAGEDAFFGGGLDA